MSFDEKWCKKIPGALPCNLFSSAFNYRERPDIQLARYSACRMSKARYPVSGRIFGYRSFIQAYIKFSIRLRPDLRYPK